MDRGGVDDWLARWVDPKVRGHVDGPRGQPKRWPELSADDMRVPKGEAHIAHAPPNTIMKDLETTSDVDRAVGEA